MMRASMTMRFMVTPIHAVVSNREAQRIGNARQNSAQDHIGLSGGEQSGQSAPPFDREGRMKVACV
jgi:hypothetical protein